MTLLEELSGIIKSDKIFNDSETLEMYSKDMGFSKPMRPRALVKPQNSDEVQTIVKWANKSGTPLVPVSSGSPRFRGDTVPSVPGAVIVDLSDINRIIKINRRNRVALIEPGVTFNQLQPKLAEEGLRLSIPFIPKPNKSVIASFLEREPTILPRVQWSFFDPLRSLELIWGDGEKFRTGETGNWPSMESGFEKKLAPLGLAGPVQTDFHKFVSAAQGSMGIVTKGSVKCEILPQIHKLFFVQARSLGNIVDFTYRLLRFRFGDELLILNNFCMASIIESEPDAVRTLARKLPPWVVLVGIAGRNVLPDEKVSAQQTDISNIAQQFGLNLVPEIAGVRNREVFNKVVNPSEQEYWKLNYKGGFQDIFFMTTLEKAPAFLNTLYSVADVHGYPSSEIDIYIQPTHQGASCHCEFSIPYDPSNQKEVGRVKAFYLEATDHLFQQGAFFSRPYGIWAEKAFNRDAQTKAVLLKIKNIFDPNNVMNPGKLCF